LKRSPAVSCMKLRLTSGGLQSIANVASRPRASFGSTRQRAWLAFQYKREIVARHGCWAQGRREVSGIVGRAELIEAGISFPARDVVNGAGCCVPTRGEPNLRNNHGIATERRNQAGWIARKRRRIASHHHRFQIDIVDRYDPNFRGRRREWIGGLEGRRQIAQRIAHWPVDEGLPVLRVSIEILAPQTAPRVWRYDRPAIASRSTTNRGESCSHSPGCWARSGAPDPVRDCLLLARVRSRGSTIRPTRRACQNRCRPLRGSGSKTQIASSADS
jgi:hypothetical protein